MPVHLRTLVLGVGNPLMSDDGVGQRLLAELASLQPPLAGVDYVDAGTLSFLLLPRIEDCAALLVLDAARLRGAPGAVREFTGTGMDEFLKSTSCSVHEIGLRDLLDAARLTDTLPARRALVGVQPDRVDWGETLSPPVAAAVPAAMALARGILERWQLDVAS
ncbi:MAG TPA: hydrogenase maturation protease [Steroidobacteraceae bacterium]|nr:hydrogenase maturation protease [Steroidobacteraceae bacterium]